MKNLFLFIMAALAVFKINAQQVPDYSSLENGTPEQIATRANEAALQAATYLLSMPPDTNNQDIKDAASYTVMWMSATPDYSFELDNACVKMYGGDPALLQVLLAAMVEYEITNPENKDDGEKVRVNAVKRLIAYAQDPKNKITIHDDLKNAIKADNKGKLDKYLSSINYE